jgi:hypothetical protein
MPWQIAARPEGRISHEKFRPVLASFSHHHISLSASGKTIGSTSATAIVDKNAVRKLWQRKEK